MVIFRKLALALGGATFLISIAAITYSFIFGFSDWAPVASAAALTIVSVGYIE
jgi:hypothetical protein